MFDPYFGGDARHIFAALAVSLSCLAYLPLLRDVLGGNSQPQRTSWLIWSVLSAISFASQVSEGATASLWFAGIQSGGTITIFMLSLSRGTGGWMNTRDALILAAACCGLGLWYATDNAVWALAISCGISLLGGTVTIAKAYADPSSETMVFWGLSLCAATFALGSVGAYDPVLLMYPAYLFVLNAGIVSAMLLGRRRDRIKTPAQHAPTGLTPA
ncbi:MAG: hypothetical protein AAFO93_13540 [Pseudomonadota bacterium]